MVVFWHMAHTRHTTLHHRSPEGSLGVSEEVHASCNKCCPLTVALGWDCKDDSLYQIGHSITLVMDKRRRTGQSILGSRILWSRGRTEMLRLEERI
ncbi:hypothetical protein J6590_094455 [Homalodisca vitripennis]|nr:hypothetical protein J6590_094455 [Homalodisca vitripennis]